MTEEHFAPGYSPVDPTFFRRVCSAFTTGITIATTLDVDGMPHGLTVSSFTSVSLAPPLILVCVDRRSARILEYFQHTRRFGVNVLSQEQKYLSSRFARPGVDRFDGVEWSGGVTGVPVLPASLAVLECTLFNSMTAGDHVILIGEVQQACLHTGDPLLYFSSEYRRIERVEPAAAGHS